MQDHIFSFVDVETTGGNARTDRIIEIGIVRVQGGKVLQTYSALINPERTLHSFITQITGINNAMLVDAPLFHEVAEQVHELLKDTIFVAHNVRFDYSFITTELRSAGIDLRLSNLCTVRLSRKLFPEFPKHNLDAIVERHGLAMENRHRALDDAMALVHFVQDLPNHHTEQHISTSIKELLKEYILPTHMTKDEVTSIPNTTGVYVFRDQDKEPLYIGKSIHIQERLFEHFSKATRSAKELRLIHSTHSISYIETAGEFGALILEAEMITTRHPLLNSRGKGALVDGKRKAKPSYTLREVMNDDGYLFAQVSEQLTIPAQEVDQGIIMFPTKRKAKDFLFEIANKAKLCKKVLGLEQGDGPCLAYGMHKCHGACVGEESFALHNKRFHQCFVAKQLSPWPFPGAITIKESDEDPTEGDMFVINHWCIIKKGRYHYEEVTWNQEDPNEDFDRNIYMIIKQALAGKFERVLVQR